MKIICAPDSLKGSLTADHAAWVMAKAIHRVYADAEVDICPISDGGEGFTQAIAIANRILPVVEDTYDPLGRLIEAQWVMGLSERETQTAVIEAASASGLTLLTLNERDPTQTTTYGTGAIIHMAIGSGAKRILIGIGGSATNDGGCGMAQALGACFYGKWGRRIKRPISGRMLESIRRIDTAQMDSRLNEVRITVASDVTNPLTGPNGAAHIYGPQKGATSEQVEQLDDGLRHLATLWREQLGIDVEKTPGAGAAGGLGGGLLAFCKAELRSGLDIVLEMVRFDQRVQGCDLCLTGEGSLDGQSLAGKAVLGVARAAAKHNVPTVAMVGRLGPGHEKAIEAGLKDAIEVAPGLSAEESMARAAQLLEEATARAIGLHL